MTRDAMDDEEKFSDQEVHEILKKAVEKAPSRALTRGEGLSLAELKLIGQEVGIDPARLEDAARAVSQRRESRPNPFLGAPTVLNFERRVNGEFDPDDTPEFLSLIRRAMGVQGELEEVHGSLEWRSRSDLAERYVTITSRDGATTVRSSANLDNTVVLTFLPAGIIGTVLSVAGLIKSAQAGSMVGMILCLAVLPVLYPILRAIVRKVSRSEAEKLEEVVEDLARLAEGSGEEAG